MGIRENGTAPARVVVGESREDAAALFGSSWDDFFVTSYADLDREVDLDALDALGLAAGDGFAAALDVARARLQQDPRFLVEAEHASSTAAAIQACVAPGAGLHLSAARPVADRVVVRIGAEAAAAEAAESPVATDRPAAATAPARPDAAGPAAAGGGIRARFRSGGRRSRLVALAVVLLVLGVALALAALGAGLDGVLVVLVAALVLGQAALSVLVRRAVLAANRAAERPLPNPRPLLLRNRQLLDKRTRRMIATLRDVQRDTQKGNTDLRLLRRYVEVVAEEQSRLSARVERLDDRSG
jgi:hypothetical protein